VFGLQKLIERKIQEAQNKGDFDNLPGSGEPLDIEDDRHIPEELRLSYKILKNADCLPPELQLQKDIRQMEDLLDNLKDEKARYRLIKKINFKVLKLNQMGKGSPLLAERELYYEKLIGKLSKKD